MHLRMGLTILFKQKHHSLVHERLLEMWAILAGRKAILAITAVHSHSVELHLLEKVPCLHDGSDISYVARGTKHFVSSHFGMKQSMACRDTVSLVRIMRILCGQDRIPIGRSEPARIVQRHRHPL